MAKFCTNCGTSLDDAATFCTSCGAALGADAPAAAPAENNNGVNFKAKVDEIVNKFKNMEPEKKQKFTKYGIFGGAGLVGLIVLIVVICLIVANTGYKGLVKDAMNAIKNVDAEAWVDLYSEYGYYEIKEYDNEDIDLDELKEDYIDHAKDSVVNMLDRYFNEKAGRDYKFTYEIKDTYEPEKYEYEELYEMYDRVTRDKDGDEEVELTPEDSWKKVIVVEIEINAKGDKNDKKVDLELVLAKEENTGWVIVDYSFGKPLYITSENIH